MREPIEKAIRGYENQIKQIEQSAGNAQERIQKLVAKRDWHQQQVDDNLAKIAKLREQIEEEIDAIHDMTEERAVAFGKLQATKEFAEDLLD